MESNAGSILAVLIKMSWQTALLAAVVWAICRFASKAPAAWRHTLWLIVVVKFFVPPFAHMPAQLAFWQKPDHAAARVVTTPPLSRVQLPEKMESRGQTDLPAAQPSREPAPAASAASAPLSPAEIALIIWLVGMCAALGIMLSRYAGQRKLLKHSHPADGELMRILAECGDEINLKRLPKMRLSDVVKTPMLVGLFKQVILLPPEMMELCSATDLRAMLLHELAHVKRRDMAGVWLHQLVQVLFFFHPVVWLAGNQMKVERELACDEMVLACASVSRKEYAAGYVSALKIANGVSHASFSLAMAEPFDMEKKRLLGILSGALPRMNTRWAIALLLIAAAGIPTFAGLASRSAMPDKEHMTVSYVLGKVKENRARMMAEIKSARGHILRHSATPYSETDTDLSVLYSNNTYKMQYKGKVIKGEERMPIGANEAITAGQQYDITFAITPAKTTIYRPDINAATVSSTKSYTGDMSNVWMLLVGRAWPRIEPFAEIPWNGKAKVIGTEIVNGDQCIVLENVLRQGSKVSWNIIGSTIWVDPKKDYAVVRSRQWEQSYRDKQRIIRREEDIKLRDYGNSLWGPAERTLTTYGMPPASRKTIKAFSEKWIYSPDFRYNVPVSEEELKLTLPKGTKVNPWNKKS